MATLGNELTAGKSPEEPPDYAEADTCVGDPDSPLSEIRRLGIPYTNFLLVVKRDSSVEGRYIVDLALPPPPSSAPDTDRKNVSLHTTSGSINAEVWVIHDGSAESKRVSLAMSSDNGRVRAKVHAPSPNGRPYERPSLDIELHADYGDVFVSLPPCFRGPITIRTGDERIALSPGLTECTALLSDVPGVREYFVGERRPRESRGSGKVNGRPEEPLDELVVRGKFTSVRINWVGERDPPEMGLDPWWTFCSGADRFFTTGRVC
ncbi:hypothetical protein BC827DRAFT_1241236 [Russula dissimulans]|nr:hypothetical protein BC827DRAFT_1241236 [Russula dissimulans]